MATTVGRPRDVELDEAIRDAATEILLDGGYTALSIEAVAARAGTSRPAFYRRYRALSDVFLDILGRRFGATLLFDSGDLRTDLVDIQRDQLAMFTDPLVQRSLAGFLEAVRNSPDLTHDFVNGFLKPRRASTVEIISRAASRGEIAAPADPEWICDLLTGPFVMRTLFPGLVQLGEDLVQQTVEAALKELHTEIEH